MAFTVKNVVDAVRPLVADNTAPYRWSDAVVRDRINESVHRVFEVRPDAFKTVSAEVPSTYDSLYDEIDMYDQFRISVIYHTASRLLMERSSDESLRKQGMDYLKAFNSMMGI